MEKKISMARRVMVVLTVIAGILTFSAGLYCYQWSDNERILYNQGLAAYRSGDLQTAIKFSDQALAAYKARRQLTWTERFVFPKPDKPLAAQAAFLKGRALLKAGQVEPAVKAFKESLELNSGNLYVGESLTEQEYQLLREAAMVVKYDLELLFKNSPEQAEKQGKPKPGKGKPDKGDKPVPGEDPGNMPGKGNRDTI